jgi:hypothetical protein
MVAVLVVLEWEAVSKVVAAALAVTVVQVV